jgi:UDP-N-acetylglucosamine--N-acetylmuramyl-(pentapeptide) pyrophosphoryl-undecaprenol N-acetylglucosamine transferase
MGQFMNEIFICGGRTGGPLIPMYALGKQINIPNKNLRIIGVRNGFETKFANRYKLDINFLPEAKLSILSFNFEKLSFELLKQVFSVFLVLFVLIYSFIKSKFKPLFILNAGSFLAPPLGYANFFLKKIGLSKAKFYTHQQDPKLGLSNKLVAQFSDKITCLYNYTRLNYSQFKNANLINNPIDYDVYDLNSNIIFENSDIQKLVDLNNSKPLILIYGGGSGSKIINDWVVSNLPWLCSRFNVIHILGSLQDRSDLKRWLGFHTQFANYCPVEFIIQDMPKLIYKSDIIISRSGIGSITELKFLKKNAILIPLKNSHQELNAHLNKLDFYIVQEDKLNKIFDILEEFKNKKLLNVNLAYRESLKEYLRLNNELFAFFNK